MKQYFDDCVNDRNHYIIPFLVHCYEHFTHIYNHEYSLTVSYPQEVDSLLVMAQ